MIDSKKNYKFDLGVKGLNEKCHFYITSNSVLYSRENYNCEQRGEFQLDPKSQGVQTKVTLTSVQTELILGVKQKIHTKGVEFSLNIFC